MYYINYTCFVNFNNMFYINIFVILKTRNISGHRSQLKLFIVLFQKLKKLLTLSYFMISNIPYTNMLHLVEYNTCIS